MARPSTIVRHVGKQRNATISEISCIIMLQARRGSRQQPQGLFTTTFRSPHHSLEWKPFYMMSLGCGSVFKEAIKMQQRRCHPRPSSEWWEAEADIFPRPNLPTLMVPSLLFTLAHVVHRIFHAIVHPVARMVLAIVPCPAFHRGSYLGDRSGKETSTVNIFSRPNSQTLCRIYPFFLGDKGKHVGPQLNMCRAFRVFSLVLPNSNIPHSSNRLQLVAFATQRKRHVLPFSI
mmetsp:Transcript_40341/g.111112  ORF Transcript_40341/g.111112 Transcript_40341/m.111112 type:complete len:232 (+) Transcript_40341:355-1050(+)